MGRLISTNLYAAIPLDILSMSLYRFRAGNPEFCGQSCSKAGRLILASREILKRDSDLNKKFFFIDPIEQSMEYLTKNVVIVTLGVEASWSPCLPRSSRHRVCSEPSSGGHLQRRQCLLPNSPQALRGNSEEGVPFTYAYRVSTYSRVLRIASLATTPMGILVSQDHRFALRISS